MPILTPAKNRLACQHVPIRWKNNFASRPPDVQLVGKKSFRPLLRCTFHCITKNAVDFNYLSWNGKADETKLD